jgi:hypothetical protein
MRQLRSRHDIVTAGVYINTPGGARLSTFLPFSFSSKTKLKKMQPPDFKQAHQPWHILLLKEHHAPKQTNIAQAVRIQTVTGMYAHGRAY